MTLHTPFPKHAVAVSNNRMHGFGTVELAARFCHAFDELRNYFRSSRKMGETVSLLEQRQAFLQRLTDLQALIRAAS